MVAGSHFLEKQNLCLKSYQTYFEVDQATQCGISVTIRGGKKQRPYG